MKFMEGLELWKDIKERCDKIGYADPNLIYKQ